MSLLLATRRRRGALYLLVAAYALLAVAWTFGNPAGKSPDESSHYLKAFAVGHGHLEGNRAVRFHPLPTDAPPLAWVKRTARLVVLPARLSPRTLACQGYRTPAQPSCPVLRSGTVADATQMGTYQPYLYAAPGVAMRFARGPVGAIWIGRAVNAALSISLIGGAVLLLSDHRSSPLVLLGLLVAVTPMVVFLGATLSPNGPEVAAGICFLAALLRLSRCAPNRWVLGAMAASGIILTTGRSLGPIWVIFDVLIVIALDGPRAMYRAVRGAGWWAYAAGFAVVLAMVACAGWEIAAQPHPGVTLGIFRSGLRPAFHEIPDMFTQYVGKFGSLDRPMPVFAYRLWDVLVVTLIGAGVLVSTRRERLTLLVLVPSCMAVEMLVSAGLLHPNGFGMQGRYVLAFVVSAPIVAGELLSRHAKPRNACPDAAPFVFACAVASGHLVGWYANARFSAVGPDGPYLFFMGHPAWSPPAGWYPWIALVLAAAAGLVVAGARLSPQAGWVGAQAPQQQQPLRAH